MALAKVNPSQFDGSIVQVLSLAYATGCDLLSAE